VQRQQFGAAGLAIAAGLFEAWDEFRERGDRARPLERLAPLTQELKTPLEQAARKSTKTKYHRLFANNLLKHWPALWSFTLLDDVEPTNNHAERGLRGAVIYRKLSLGSQSELGRAHHRAVALGLGHLPPPRTLPLRLHQRRPQRQHPRRPHPCARLTSRGS
jgi:hypothetical protein